MFVDRLDGILAAACILVVAAVAGGQQEKADAEALPELEGIVVNHMGGGIAGLAVTIYRDGKKIGETTTTGTGEFAVGLDIKHKCEITVEITGEGYTPYKTTKEFDPEDPPYVDTELLGALKVSGKVVGLPEKKPLAGAIVKLEFQSRLVKANTEADGTFELKDVAPGPALLEAESEGFGRERQKLMVGDSDEPVTVVLKKERVIEITVVDDTDQPVADATVELEVEAGELGRDLRIQKTDKKGRSSFRNIHFDTPGARARILHPDHVQTNEFTHVVQIAGEKLLAAEKLVLPRAAKIAGTITDAQTGNPIHSARVFAGTPGPGFVPVGFTDRKGKFMLSGLAGGKVPVTVHRTDYAPALEEATCVTGRTATVDFRLVRGRPLGGVVQDADGKPLAGLIVGSTLWKGYDTLALRTFTDESGRFEFENAPAGKILFAVLAEGGQPVRKDIELEAGKTDYVLKIESLAPAPPTQAVTVGSTAPDVEVTTLDGRKIALARPEGRYLLVDFWATWCGPCIEEIPHLQEVWRRTKDRGDFLLISISLDRTEQVIRGFLEQTHMPWLHVFGQAGGANAAADAFGVHAIPATFLIGPDGKVLGVNLRGPELGRKLLDILPERPSDRPPAKILR